MAADRFTDDGRYIRWLTPCATCLHKHPGKPTCEAYPEQIPQAILDGIEDHREPYPGDGGIQYEPLPDEEPEFA